MIRMKKLLTAAVLAAVAVPAAGCGWIAESVEIIEVQASGDGLEVEIWVASCGGELSAKVEEDLQSVAVWVTARNATDEECSDGLVIELEEPLGGRRFIDGFDFTERRVERGG